MEMGRAEERKLRICDSDHAGWRDRMVRIYRHYSSILLLFGVMVSFIAFMNGAEIYRQIKYALAEVNNFQYKYSYTVTISDIKDFEQMIDTVIAWDGNSSIEENLIYSNADNEYRLYEIVLSQKEDLPYPIEIINENGQLIIGRKLKDLCYEENGILYMTLNGQPIAVRGITSKLKTDILDYKLFLYCQDYEELKTYLGQEGQLNLECGSNVMDLEQEIYAAYENTDATIFYEKSGEPYVEVGSQNAEEKFYLIIAIFALVNCIAISEFWVMRRKQEIIIRKIFGFSDWKLFWMLYKQMLLIAGSAVVIVSIGQWILSLIKQNMEFSIERMIWSVLGIFMIALVISIVPVYQAAHYKIDKGAI